MKRLFYLLLLLPFLSIGQTSTGMEQFFDYGIQVEPTALQTIANPTFFCTVGADGTIGQIPFAGTVNRVPKLGALGLTQSNITDTGVLVTTSTDMTVNNVKIGRGIGNFTTNTALGSGVLGSNISGTESTGAGWGALGNMNTGIGNVAVGRSAGAYYGNVGLPGANDLNYSIFVGNDTRPLNDGDTNEIVIGTDVTGQGSNTTTIGNPSTLSAKIYGDLTVDTINTSGGLAMADTGVKTFAGLTTNSSTTINIGAVTGQVVDNETNPASPVKIDVNYAGATNVTVTTVGSGQSSHVMLDSAGTISFQNTLPTSAERKAKIWLGKVSHPSGSITLVANEPDYVTSPMAFSRDWVQATGPYANNGVYPSANGANLNINISQGTITGDGINFVTDRTSPNTITMGPAAVQPFFIRTQTGAGGAAVTAITPGNYDVAGTITAIPGSSNQATIQYVWAIPGQGYIVQLGQTLYATFAAAVSFLGKETSFVVYPNLPGNAIPIAALVVTKGCTALNDTGVTAQFFRADKTGDFFGASAGFATATLQSAYNNSLVPQITTSTALGAVTIRRGSAADTDNILVGQNGAGTNTFTLTGAGIETAASVNSNGAISAVSANARGNYFTNALTATANNDNLTCLDLSPTFTNGAFTGVKNNIIKAAWNTSSFSISDLVGAGWVGLYSTPTPNNTNYFLAATTGNVVLNSPVSNGTVSLRQGGVSKGHFNATTGNFTLQNGGTFTDAGYRLDVFDNTRLNGTLTLSTAPTTSAGSYDIITRNSSTGVIEKSSSLVLITITTAVSITTATTDSNSVGQNGRHVVIDNGVNAINLTCNGGVTTSYGKIGSGAVTFVQGSGRTLVQLSGTAVMSGIAGSKATLWSSGTTDYLEITNY